MIIHTFGDSHCQAGWSQFKNVACHHLGPLLAYSFGKDIFSRCDIRQYYVKDGDYIVFCLGEIDCRCHIHKHVSTKLSYKSIIDFIVNKYFEAIRLNVEALSIKVKGVCVYNIVPPVEKNTIVENKDWPFIGSDEERLEYVKYFNKKLMEKCKDYNYIFIDIYDKVSDSRGFLRKDKSDGNLHIGSGTPIQEFLRDDIFFQRGQITQETPFGKGIYDLSQIPNIHTILEVGTWNGQGTTECIVGGILRRDDIRDCHVYSVEASRYFYEKACQYWNTKGYSFLHLLYGRVSDTIMLKDEIEKHPMFSSVKTHYDRWYSKDVIDFNIGPKLKYLPKKIDMIILDGGEFTGEGDAELIDIHSVDYVCLDDTLSMKNSSVLKNLKEKGWTILLEGNDRSGFAILKRPEIVMYNLNIHAC